MSAVSHEVWGARPTAIRWTGLMALVLLAACGGERRETPGAGNEGASVGDTAGAVTPAAAAPASTDTSTVRAGRDTAAKQVAERPAAPAPRTKPTKPAQPAAPKPAQPAPPSTPAASATQDTAAPTAETAPTPDTAASADTTSTAVQGQAAEEGQTATAPLRDQYHQAPKDTVDQATYDGWKQYNLNCARCHGEDVGGTTIAPHLVVSLKPDGPINTQEAFVQVVCAGRPERGMPAWCALGMDPAKINQIFSYVKGRSDGKIRPGRPAVKQEG